MRVLDLSPTDNARIPAVSIDGLAVRSRCSNDFVSGRNSARDMAPSVVRPVSARKRRLSEVLSVNAVRRAATYTSVSGKSDDVGNYKTRAARTYTFHVWSAAGIGADIKGFEDRVVFLCVVSWASR